LSRDGARALVSWDDEGRQQQPDGTIAPPRDKPRVDVFAISDGQLLQSIEVAYNALALSDDGTRVVVAKPVQSLGVTPDVVAFDVADGAQRWSVPSALKAIVTIPGANAVAGIAYDPSRATRLQIFDLDTGAVRLDVPLADYGESLAASPDGKLLAIGRAEVAGADSQSTNAHYLLTNVADGALVREVVLPSRSPMEGVALSPDGRFIAAVVSLDGTVPPTQLDPSGFYAHELVIWDGDALAWRRPAEHRVSAPQTIAFSPDGTLLLSAEYDAVALYAVATGDEMLREHYKQNVF
jgi:WD40 repeat protein